MIPKAGQATQVGVPGGVDLFPIGAVHPLRQHAPGVS